MIEVTGLRKRFGPVRALDGMSFTVRPRARHRVRRPDGAGEPVTELRYSLPAPGELSLTWSEVILGRAHRVLDILRLPEIRDALLTR